MVAANHVFGAKKGDATRFTLTKHMKSGQRSLLLVKGGNGTPFVYF